MKTTGVMSERRGGANYSVISLSCAYMALSGCTPCFGKMGEELKTCEAEAKNELPGEAGSGGAAEANIGPTAGNSGSSPTSPHQPGFASEPSTPFSENFEHESDTADFERSDAVAYEGKFGLRAPELNAGEQAEYAFDCGGHPHNQIEFVYAGANARLYVDDVLYEELSQGSGWHKRNLILTEGAHAYKWQVSVEEKGRPTFWLDAIKCTQTDPADNTTGRWDFDQGFVPKELSGFSDGMIRWQITDSVANAGGFGARPPMLPAGGSAELSMDCGGASHTQLEFIYAGANAKLSVDNVLYEELSQGSGWHQRKLIVPAGTHTYKWSVSTETQGRPTFWIDTIKCFATDASDNTTGRWDFDQGFAPKEFVGFDDDPSLRWQITDSVQNAGGFGVRPPILPAGGKAELSMKCGDESHSELSFVYAGAGVEFLVDDSLYEELGQGSGWHERRLIVPEGAHSYAWRVRVEESGRTNFWIDTIKCTSTAARPNTNGRWDFDQGFVPLELSGFDGHPATRWQITDTVQNAGGFGVRPGILPAGGVAELTLQCASPSNGQVQFIYAGSAELLLDGAVKDELNQGSGWHTRMIPITAGSHSIGWRVAATEAGRPTFWLDTILCGGTAM